MRRVWCNARVEQIGFYSKHFELVEMPGSRFEKGGREYVLMERLWDDGEMRTQEKQVEELAAKIAELEEKKQHHLDHRELLSDLRLRAPHGVVYKGARF